MNILVIFLLFFSYMSCNKILLNKINSYLSSSALRYLEATGLNTMSQNVNTINDNITNQTIPTTTFPAPTIASHHINPNDNIFTPAHSPLRPVSPPAHSPLRPFSPPAHSPLRPFCMTDLLEQDFAIPAPTSSLCPLTLPHQRESNSPLPPPLQPPTTLSEAYPDHFKGCSTLPQVLKQAEKLSVFGLDMSAAVKEVLARPRIFDLDMIQADSTMVKEIGLTALFALKSDKVRPYSLQPKLFIAKYPDVSTNARLAHLAENGVTTNGDADFVPNNGINSAHYPPSVADDRVICFHLSKGQQRGKYLILPTELFTAMAAEENLNFQISPAFIVKKRDEDTGRLVINYSESGPNFDAKPIDLTETLGPIKPPQYADVCRLLLNAKRLFPGQEIFALRRDVDGAYNRLLYNLDSALKCAFNVTAGNEQFTAVPITCMFGDQQVNFEFDQVSRAIAEVVATHAHELTLSPLDLTTVCTDDIIAIGGLAFIKAISTFIGETVGTGTAPGLLGLDAIALGKDLFGTAIEILGWLFDCHHETIAPNALTAAKLYHLLFTSLGQKPYAGQPVPLAHLQRISAHVIRAADVITAMLPFSRSFATATIGVLPNTNAYLTRTNVHDIARWRDLLTIGIDDSRVLTSPVFAPHIKKRLTPLETDEERDLRAAEHATIVAFSDAATGNGIDATPLLGGFVPDHSWFHLSLPNEANSVTDLRNNKRRSDINVHEFTAIVLTALLCIHSLNTCPTYFHKIRHIQIWSDNTSSVFRARSNRSHLPIYSLMLTILTTLQVQHQCLITVGFIKGYRNIFGDATSRNFNVPNGQAIRKLLQPLNKWNPSSNLVNLILQGCSSSLPTDWSRQAKIAIAQELLILSASC